MSAMRSSMSPVDDGAVVAGASVSPLRVLFLMEGLYLGGAERRFIRLARTLDRRRFQPVIGTLLAAGPLEAEVRGLGIPVESFARRGRFDPSPALRLARYLHAEHVEVVHAMHWLSNAMAAVAAWWLRDIAVIGSTVSTIYDESAGGRYRLLLDRRLWRRMDRMVVNATALRDYLIQRGLPAGRVTIIPNGVDVPAETSRTQASRAAARGLLGVAPDAPLVGIVARLDPVKDHQTFLRAAAIVRERFPSARFAVVGPGPERPALEALAASLHLSDAVIFSGAVPSSDCVLPAFDVFVLCSRFEGMSTALLEAGAWGLPLVATPVGGSAEIVHEGRTGYLVPVAGPQALADRICALLAHPVRARALGEAARLYVAEHFSARAMVTRYEGVYHSAALTRRLASMRQPATLSRSR